MKILLAFAVTIALVAGQYPFCQGTYNNNSLVTNPPVLLNKSDHGLKYMITDPNDNTTFAYIAVLEGTPYEMGYAMGSLFQEEVTNIMAVMEQFIKQFANSYIDGVPEWIVEIDSDVSEDVQLGLNLERIATAHFTPERFTEELQGMADASGVPFDTLRSVNLYPELIRAHCSIGGFWNPATLTGKLLQLRTLDWDAECPMNYFPTIIIRHSAENGSNPFAVLGWAGVVGALAGYSPLMGISEADWLPDMDNETTIFGKPWMYVLRDVLQFGTDLESGIEILQNANRTYKVYLGIGSSADNQLRGVQYEALNITIYSDQNWSHPFSPVHPQFNGIMYWDKSSAQNRPCFGNVFAVNYGNITPETLWQVAAPMDTTGDTMVAVYDFGANMVYVSYSDPATGTPAYQRPLMSLNMTYLFSVLPNNTEFPVTE